MGIEMAKQKVIYLDWLKATPTEKLMVTDSVMPKDSRWGFRLGLHLDFPMGFGLVKPKAIQTVKRTGWLMPNLIPKGWPKEIHLGWR